MKYSEELFRVLYNNLINSIVPFILLIFITFGMYSLGYHDLVMFNCGAIGAIIGWNLAIGGCYLIINDLEKKQ